MSEDKSGLASKRRATSPPLLEIKKAKVTMEITKIENVHLDDLVLQNIVANESNCFDNISRERLNKRFAMILRSYFDSKKFKLTFTFTMEQDKVTVSILLDDPRFEKQNDLFGICLTRENLRAQLIHFFARIRRFRRIIFKNAGLAYQFLEKVELIQSLSDDVATIFQQEVCNKLIQLDQLELTYFGSVVNGSRIIQMLSPMLKQLKFHFSYRNQQSSDTEAHQFWLAVASCANLKNLCVAPDDKSYFPSNYMQDCLKVLKIRKFEYESTTEIDSEWLNTALNGNENLRQISLTTSRFNEGLEVWNGQRFPVLKPILARVCCFELHVPTTDELDEHCENIEGILQSLPENGHICVKPNIFGLEDESMLIFSDFLKFCKDLVMRASRTIKVRIGIIKEGKECADIEDMDVEYLQDTQRSMKECTERVFDSFAEESENSELTIERYTDGVEMKYRNSKFLVSYQYIEFTSYCNLLYSRDYPD